ncbi:hypothetical protein E2C01_057314 [Portunus trituberculatus]|uniref:Uncharacterized protein n=1 Tax=Portunus trituberculatus TaxID=210409 RepID=A0A5B7GT38_PORTR|nr:hypothetical protein [Portunus trituberculatus]
MLMARAPAVVRSTLEHFTARIPSSLKNTGRWRCPSPGKDKKCASLCEKKRARLPSKRHESNNTAGVSGSIATKWSASSAKESTPKCNINGYLAQRRLNLDYETYFRDNAPK